MQLLLFCADERKLQECAVFERPSLRVSVQRSVSALEGG